MEKEKVTERLTQEMINSFDIPEGIKAVKVMLETVFEIHGAERTVDDWIIVNVSNAGDMFNGLTPREAYIFGLATLTAKFLG